MTITPPLYLFDPDQTHDLLWAERIDPQICDLLSNAFLSNGPFVEGALPIVLVERYIPGGDSIPWASEWTMTYFEFLKPLSRTHLLNDGEINGSAYGFEPEYRANLPTELDLGASFPVQIEVKVPKGQTGLISWLERTHVEVFAWQYCPQVTNKIQIWMRRQKVITAIADDVTLEIFVTSFLHNSVVLQNATLEGLSQAEKRLLLYEYLDDVLEDCYSQLRISEPKALTAVDVTLLSDYTPGFNHRLLYSSPLFSTVPSLYYFATLLYAVPPKRNNQPLFTLEGPRANLGKPPVLIAGVVNNPEGSSLTFTVSLTHLDLGALWPENAVKVPWGLDFNQPSRSPALVVPLANNIASFAVTASLKTFTNNHNPSESMPRLSPINGAPVVKTIADLPTRSGEASVWVNETHCFYRSSTTEPEASLLNGLDVIPDASPNRWWYRTEHTASYPINQTRSPEGGSIPSEPEVSKSGFTFFFDLDYSYPESAKVSINTLEYSHPGDGTQHYLEEAIIDSRPFANSIYFDNDVGFIYTVNQYHQGINVAPTDVAYGSQWKTINQYFYQFNPRFISVSFSANNLELFYDDQVALFRHDLELTEHLITEWRSLGPNYDAIQPDSWYWPNEEGPIGDVSRDTLNYHEVVNQMLVKTTYPNNLTNGTAIINSLPGNNGSQLKYSDSGPLPHGYFRIGRPDLSGVIASTQRLTRSLRVQPLTKPLYILYQPGGVTYPTEAQFLKLIEPQPGFFICDPNPDPLQNKNFPLSSDPDNTDWIGDLMPDSIRVKEIHAALQADKYANDDKYPASYRVANLGWLIDKMANVLGLHFASDGEMLKVRDTEHKKDGETIPEQWQIGQWGKNNWIATKSNGDKVPVNGVGYAYEVRSNGFGTDKFTGASNAIEEGGWVLVNSLIQLLEVKYDDDDRAFGLQDLGANVIPRADKTGYIAYEGMHSLLIEIAYMLSAMSGNISRSEVLNMKSVAILQELLASQGLPVELKTLPATVAGQTVQIPYPGLSSDSPSLVDFMFWILSNLAPVVSAQLAYKQGEEGTL